jgi:uridine kinase
MQKKHTGNKNYSMILSANAKSLNIISLEALRDVIYQKGSAKKPVIIAVDGPSGAGKSYFSRQLSGILTNSFIVEMDYFISWNSIDSGLERAINQLFEPLSKEGKARFQARDWTGDFFGEGLGEWKEVPERNYIILEGIASSRKEYSAYLHISIWVEAPEDLCIKRGLERNGVELLPHWESFKRLEKEFFRKDNTKARADYIVNGITGEITGTGKLQNRL